MKELYTSPEVKLINFMAQERLASDTEDYGLSEGTVPVEYRDSEDVRIPFIGI